MNEEKYTLINGYFNGLLDGAAQQQVQELVKTDAEFAAAFHLQEAMEQFPAAEMRRRQFEGQLTMLNAEFFPAEASVKTGTATTVEQPVRKVNYGRLSAIAAAMLVLVVAVWFMFRPQPISYQRFAAHTPMHITTRGDGGLDITVAEQAFNSNNFALALEKITSLRQAKPDDLALQFLQAICLIELNRSAEARNLLEPIATGASALRSDAIWYMGLSYLKENNLEQCRAIMQSIPAGDFHYQQALEILGK
jgi:predicted Zn-dependent protease